MRKNQIVVKKESLNKIWKSYYIIKDVDKINIDCVRCSVNSISSYTYVFKREEVEVLQEVKMHYSRYIHNQLNKMLIPGMKTKLYLKITGESMKLLDNNAKVLCLYETQKLKGYVTSEMYELFGASIVQLEQSYQRDNQQSYTWIQATIGVKFQRQATKSN